MTFKSMLAAKTPADLSVLPFPMLASPKLDGVRCHIINGQAVSRNLLPFKNPKIQERFGRSSFNGLDGEFMVGDPTDPMAFRKTGTINSHSGPVEHVKLWVFDDFTLPTLSYAARLDTARYRVDRDDEDDSLAIVPHHVLRDLEELLEYEARCLADGYEGVMLRSADGKYKYGRSTLREGGLIKVKRFEDSEAVIDTVAELLHNDNDKTLVSNGKAKRNTRKDGMVPMGVLGALNVRDIHSGVAFSIGSGFTADERERLWRMRDRLPGMVVKYKFFPSGSKEKPRFPVFLGFRDKIDL